MKPIKVKIITAPEVIDPETVVVRHITPSAMQRRFTLDEETAIVDQAPTKLKLARDRMLNASYVDLDLDEVVEGVNALGTFLSGIDNPEVPAEKLVTDVPAWVADKLRNGESTEV